MKHFQVPEQKKLRVIIDTDAKNEADDQYAIVHACLTEKLLIQGIVAAHFGGKKLSPTELSLTEKEHPGSLSLVEAAFQAGTAGGKFTSMEASYQECVKLLELMGKTEDIPVFRGAEEAMKSETEYEYSEGSAFLVEEAKKESNLPLFVISLGTLTNIACALQKHPEIADRFTLIWIGGGPYPEGGREANLSKDILAANLVMQSGVELWQVPSNVYSRMLVSLTELEEKVYPCGEIGKYLFEQMVAFNDQMGAIRGWPTGESWSLGDSPTVGLLLDQQFYAAEYREAPKIAEDMTYQFDGTGRKIRVYHDINSRFILEDMFCKLKQFAEQ